MNIQIYYLYIFRISFAISIDTNIHFRSEVLRNSMYGLSKILGTCKDRSRRAGGRS